MGGFIVSMVLQLRNSFFKKTQTVGWESHLQLSRISNTIDSWEGHFFLSFQRLDGLLKGQAFLRMNARY